MFSARAAWIPVLATIFAAAPSAKAQPAPPPVASHTAAPPAAAGDFFIPLPARFVAGPLVFEAKWSPDGRYVSGIANDIDLRSFPIEGEPPHTVSLVVWSASTHKSVTVWSDSSAGGQIEQNEWVPGTAVIFVVARWTDESGSTHQGLWRIDARRSGGTKIDGFAEGERLLVSPNQPYAFLQGSDRDGSYLKLLASNGSMGAPVRVPARMIVPGDWSADGRALLLAPPPVARSGSTPEEPKLSWMQCDGRSGALSNLDKQPRVYEPPARNLAFRITTTAVPAVSPSSSVKFPWTSDQLQTAWLEQGTKTDEERFLIAADASRTEVSPAGDGILYVNSEGAFVVSLLRASKQVVEQARAAAQRTQLLNNGKQIALAVMMWSQDHDDNLPGSDGDLKSTLKPYVRSESIFGGADGGAFIYSLNGGAMKDIKDPASTMMGYITGPGGYAVVYADGHVQWSKQLPNSQSSGG